MAYKGLLKEDDLKDGAKPFYNSLSNKKQYKIKERAEQDLNSCFAELQYCCNNFRKCDIEKFKNVKKKLIKLKESVEKYRKNGTYNDCLKKLEEAHSKRLFEDYKNEFIKLKGEFDRKPDKSILETIKGFLDDKIEKDKNLTEDHEKELKNLISEYKNVVYNYFLLKEQTELPEKIKSFEQEIKHDPAQIYEKKYTDICKEIKESLIGDIEKQNLLDKCKEIINNRRIEDM